MLPQSLFVLASALAVASAGPLRKRCGETTDPVASVTDSASSASSSVSAVATASLSTASSVSVVATASLSTASAVSAVATPTAPSNAETPVLPVTGGASELPSASGKLTNIAVGHGIQNYTCSAAGANATSAGALAVLYDLTPAYTGMSPAQLNQLVVDILHTTDLPLNLASAPASGNQYAADAANPFKPDADLAMPGLAAPLKTLGHHYFDTAMTPTFDLYSASALFKGPKLLGVKAPATADRGILNTGAVDWLQLGDKGASKGLVQVYRVVTAGGAALACTEAGQSFSVPYTTQYWFYQ